MNCRLYGPKQGPSCFFAPSDASVRVNTQLWVADMYGFPATFRWVQVKVGGRKCQGLVPSEYVQPPRAKVQALLKHLFATMTAQMHRCAVHQSSQCPSNCIAQPQRAAKCVLCSRTTCVQGTRVICIGVRCSRWRALVAQSSGRLIRNPVLILLQMCFRPRQLHGLLLIALQVLIVHQRPLCIQSLTTKLLTHKRLAAQEATQPGTLRSCEILYINGKPFEVPLVYTGYLPSDQWRCALQHSSAFVI
jgi:hypothetical protein